VLIGLSARQLSRRNCKRTGEQGNVADPAKLVGLDDHYRGSVVPAGGNTAA
jgi:hypothetical protein